MNPVKNNEEKNNSFTKNLDDLPKDEFSLEKVQLIWDELLSEIKQTESRIYSGIKESKIEISQSNPNQIIISYVSQSSLSEFEPFKPKFLKKLQTLLNNYQIELASKVEALKDVNFVMRKDEIFQKMAEKNPLLIKLKDTLDLDIF